MDQELLFNPKLPRAQGLQYLKRRFKQLFLMMDRNFSDSESMMQETIARYSLPSEVSYYEKWIQQGLLPFEKEAVFFAENDIQGKTALVIGCGTGREAFALEERGFKVVGVDPSESMIDIAIKLASTKQSNCVFCKSLTEVQSQFDLIFITPSLLNHFPETKKRIEYLSLLANYAHSKTWLCNFVEQFEIKPGSIHYWASMILKVRSLFSKNYSWEPGDTIKSYLGYHNTEIKPVFYHFYKNHSQISSELKKSGWVRQYCLPKGYWVCSQE